MKTNELLRVLPPRTQDPGPSVEGGKKGRDSHCQKEHASQLLTTQHGAVGEGTSCVKWL